MSPIYTKCQPQQYRADYRKISPTTRAAFLSQVALNGFRATHYFYYGVQNHSLPNKFWNKNQQTFEYSSVQNYIFKAKKASKSLVQNRFELFHSALLGGAVLPTAFIWEISSPILGEISPCQQRDQPGIGLETIFSREIKSISKRDLHGLWASPSCIGLI